MAWNLVGSTRAVSVATAFTANLTAITPPKGHRVVVKGWALTISGAAAGLALRFGSSGTSYLASYPANPTFLGLPVVREGVRFVGAVDEIVQLVGGATGAIIDGDIEIEFVHAALV